jgi:ABC-2 type transport system ATP-binding protein
MLRIINLHKQYGRLAAVDNLNIEVAPGEIFGFLGPNGAGKTTTIRVMMGILRASSGRVILGGHDVEQEPQQAKAIAGFIPDRPFIYEKLSGKEFLTFIGRLHRMESARLRCRIDELLEYFELVDWQDELVEGFSHGMKQRLVLCAALIHEPRILIVDEPMVGLDPKGARTIKDLFRSLAKAGTTVFLSTHSISVAEEVCHRIGIIQKGHLIASGTMADLYQLTQGHDSNLEDVFLELTQQQDDLPTLGRERQL